MNKQWRFIFLLFSILALGIVLLWWFAWQKTPGKPEMPAQIVQKPQSYESALPAGRIESRKNQQREQRSFRFFDTIAPLVEPFETLIPSAADIQSKTSNVISTPQPQRENSISQFDPLPASDPIFKKLYPDYYIAALKALHHMMKNDGFLSAGSLFTIANENDLFSFLETLITYGETKQYIKQTDAARFRIALNNEVKKILYRERFQYERTQSFRPFLDSLFTFLRTKTALADVVTSPDCYADRNPVNPIPGVNVPWPLCCNCGLTCPDLDFVDDCGPDGDDCDIQLGCLNLICPNGNAIWDPLTGICGCDDVSGAVDAVTGIVDIVISCF